MRVIVRGQSCYQLIEQYSQAVEVESPPIHFILEDFRTKVLRTSTDSLAQILLAEILF